MSRNQFNDVYFATLGKNDGYLDGLRSKLSSYRNFCKNEGLSGRWALSLSSYYGSSPDGKLSWANTPQGDFGELVGQKVNDYHRLLKHELVLAVQNRPAGIAKAINSDVRTLRDARVGTMLVEYLLTDPAHHFEEDYAKALELALLSAEAYVVKDWDTEKGEVITEDEETGKEVKAGDLTQRVYPIWNAACDVGADNAKGPWRIFSHRENKFDLAAKYAAFREEIISNNNTSSIVEPLIRDFDDIPDTDYIWVHKFIHFPSAALPQGRYTIFIADCILLDNPFPYNANNVIRIRDADLLDTAFGHTGNYDLLGIEQVTDTLHSIVLTNQSTFGVPTIVGPKGGGVNHVDLGKGLRYLELDPQFVGMVKTLELVNTAPEIFGYIDKLGVKKGEISGINSILSGDPAGALKGSSGSALALLQAQALTFNSGVTRSFYQLLSTGGNTDIELLRQFADQPRILRVVGKSNAQAVKEFKYDAKTLNAVSTIVYEPVSAVLQTAAGKLAVADALLQKGLITSPRRYIEVLTTGNLSVLIDDDIAKQEAIIEENEYLTEGKPVLVLAHENHKDHIASHSTLTDRPNAKEDPGFVKSVTDHIQMHTDMWVTLSQNNPALLIATGQDILPVGPGMQSPGGPQPVPPPGGPGPGGPGPQIPQAMNAQAPAEQAAEQVKQPNMPNMPVNPATGERAAA